MHDMTMDGGGCLVFVRFYVYLACETSEILSRREGALHKLASNCLWPFYINFKHGNWQVKRHYFLWREQRSDRFIFS
jgi:hypothetical protein